jgi:hypothetical protein
MLGYLANKTRVPFRGRLNLDVLTSDKRSIIHESVLPDAFQKLLAAYGTQEE